MDSHILIFLCGDTIVEIFQVNTHELISQCGDGAVQDKKLSTGRHTVWPSSVKTEKISSHSQADTVVFSLCDLLSATNRPHVTFWYFETQF